MVSKSKKSMMGPLHRQNESRLSILYAFASKAWVIISKIASFFKLWAQKSGTPYHLDCDVYRSHQAVLIYRWVLWLVDTVIQFPVMTLDIVNCLLALAATLKILKVCRDNPRRVGTVFVDINEFRNPLFFENFEKYLRNALPTTTAWMVICSDPSFHTSPLWFVAFILCGWIMAPKSLTNVWIH